VTIAAARLYSRHTDFWDEVHAVFRASSWGAVSAVLLSFFQHPEETISRSLVGSLWLLSLPTLVLVRYRLTLVLAKTRL